MIRVIMGFILAPLFGPLIYYALLYKLSPFSFDFPGISLSNNLSFFIAVIVMIGPMFYPPAVVSNAAVMLIIRHFYSWNMTTCIIGALISNLLLALLFMIFLLFIGSGFMLSKAGFHHLFAVIAVPSVLTGILFWLVAVCRNDFLDSFL